MNELSDIEPLLIPIANSATGCGEDLSFSEEFTLIQKARVEDDESLSQGEWVTQRRIADWPFVIRTAGDLLTQKSKDLRLGMWWAEAQTKQHGFNGFAQGLVLLTALVNQFWEYIYPEAEQGDQEARIVLLGWFTNNMLEVLQTIPFAKYQQTPLSINQLISARNVDEKIRKQPDLEEEFKQGKLTVSQFTQGMQSTSHTELAAQITALQNALEQWQQFTTLVDDKLGYDAPVFTPVSDILKEVMSQITKITGNTATDQQNTQIDTATELTSAHTTTNAVANTAQLNLSSGNHLQARQQALQTLQQISNYFKTNEPHSPVNYLLDKAVYWANLPLHEWLAQVVKEDEVLTQLQELLSSKPKGDNAQGE